MMNNKVHDFLEVLGNNQRIVEQFPKKQKKQGLQFHCDDFTAGGNVIITGFRKPLCTITLAPENFLELRKYIDRGLHYILIEDGRILWRNNKSKREAETLYHNLHTHNQLNIT